MQRSLRLSLSLSGIAALALSNFDLLPATAQESSAEDLGGVMSISLKDVVKPTIGFQGALQGAGTPNQAGIGGFLPLFVGDNSVFFADVLLNTNFADYGNDSSIINTEVAGTTISTSSRLGYRWLNNDRSWMFGVNAGYDSRPMNTGNADTGVDVTGKRDVFFQQVAASLEGVSETWNFNAYGLFPIGDTEQVLNDRYRGGALSTYGLDVGYAITPEWDASIGYYYQHGDDLTADDGSGVLAQLAYEITDGLTLAVKVSYDEAFETRVLGNIEYRFGSGSATQVEKKKWQTPVLQSLTESVKHRDVRVHDGNKIKNQPCGRKTDLGDSGAQKYKSTNGNRYGCFPTYQNTVKGGFYWNKTSTR
jgi:hypothetical protein